MNSELRVADKKDWLKGATGDWEMFYLPNLKFAR